MTPELAPHVRYRIVESLGRGGMGEVCLADDLMLDRQIALKFLAAAGGADAVGQLLAEARAAAALDHPFICSIYEVTTLEGRPCIAMEYVRGETLERRLRRGPVPVAEGLEIADEIAEALDAAHRRRVIHGDLKPANVMLTEDRHIKVMDFGLATRLPVTSEDVTMPSTRGAAVDVGLLRGTPAYMAPEQIRGEAVDRRSDIFAFGILLYELLSGVNPFRRGGVDVTLAAILGEPIGDLAGRVPGMPPPVAALVSRLLSKDPTQRCQSFGDVRMDLRRASGDLSAPSSAPALPTVPKPPMADTSSALIGRDAERAQLLQAVRQAVAGRGTMLVLTGDAGIGKSRLAEEALGAARGLGCRTFVGRCCEREGTPPLVAFIEILEDASRLMPAADFRRAVGASAPELARLLPDLYRMFPDMEAALELPPQLRQRFLFANIQEFLTRASRIAPLAVFIDDLQWTDESTLQLTQHLAAHLQELPIVLITAYRPVDTAAAAAKGALQHLFERVRAPRRDTASPQSLRAAIGDLTRQGFARAVTLRPFTEQEVRGMLAVLGRSAPPPAVVRRFLEQTGGNPFFVAELFRHLKDEGRLFDARGRWRRDLELDEVDIPESVRVVLEYRVARVSEAAQTVLTAAAVIGRQFELDLLEAVAEVDAGTLMSALEEAEETRLLKGPSGRQDIAWRFPHQLICQTLVAALPHLRRQRLHVRIADVMARLDGERGRYAADIAHHLYSAGPLADADRTALALMRAGEAAQTVYATGEAIQHFRRALDVLQAHASRKAGGASQGAPGQPSASATRRRLQERLADLLALTGDRAEAMEYYEMLSGAEGAEPAGIEHARIARKMGTLHWQAGDRDAALTCYQRALAALGEKPAGIEAAHLYQELGLAAFRSGDNARAIEWAERALRSAEEARSDPAAQESDVRREATAAIAQATNTIGVALARGGQFERAREHVERSVAAARELGLLDVACRAYANLGVLYSTVEPKRAIDVSLTGLELASKIGAASLQSYMYANLAAAYCALTDRCETEGLQAAEAAATLDRELGQLDHLAVPLIVKGQIHQCRGELQTAQEAYREALALAERIGEPQLILPCYDGLATIHLDRGDRETAVRYMEQARALCERTGLDPDTLLLLPFLC